MSPFSPFPIFSMAVADPPPPPGPMPIPAANQTFRNAVLPVLSELNIHLDLPDQEIPTTEGEFGELVAYVAFNFNNPTCLVDSELICLDSTKPQDQTSQISARLRGSNQNVYWPDQPSVVASDIVSDGDVAYLGQKAIPGLQNFAGFSSNKITPALKKWNYALFVYASQIVDPPDDIQMSGSSFHKFKFISANPANPQTMVYDITA